MGLVKFEKYANFSYFTGLNTFAIQKSFSEKNEKFLKYKKNEIQNNYEPLVCVASIKFNLISK